MDPRRAEGDVWARRRQDVSEVQEGVERVDGAAAVRGQGDVADVEMREEGGDDGQPGADAIAGVGDGCGAAEARPVDVDDADLVVLGEGVFRDVEIAACSESAK